MNSIPKFCGKCGMPLEQGTCFCGKCGAPVLQAKDPEPVSPVSPEKPRGNNSFLSQNAMTSAWQWGVIWLIGWLPIGILFSGLYDHKRALNPDFYSNYPRTWGTTLPGMMTAYGIGALVAGLLAGLLIYRTFKRKKLAIGLWGVLPALIWALLWCAVLVPLSYTDDGTLMIAIPILGLIFGALVSRLGTGLLCKQYVFAATAKEKKRVAIGWAISSLIGSFVAMAFSGL